MLQRQLLNIMKRELQEAGLQFSPYCMQQIEGMVGHAIQRMRTGNVIDHAGHVMSAERNLRSLIKYFCNYAREVGSFPKLSNSDFDAALLDCPTFWPYRSSS
jgi:hypothetical protein